MRRMATEFANATTWETIGLHFALCGNVLNPDTGKPAELPELWRSSEGRRWTEPTIKEWARLMQGHKQTKGLNTVQPTHRKDVPIDAAISHLRTVAPFRPEKDNPWRVRVAFGGNNAICDGPTTTRTAELGTIKILINSITSARNGRFMTIDLKDFCLNTIAPNCEHICARFKDMPKELADATQQQPL
jgi:hypothetical protein